MVGRKVIYAALLFGFYTFLIVFSMRIGLLDLVIPVLAISVISYGWFLLSVFGQGPMILDYKDLLVQIFIYSFISFAIIFTSLLVSKEGIDFLRLSLLSSPVIVWIFVWTDFYFQRIKGNL